MTWQPIAEAHLLEEIDRGVARMTIEQLRLWDTIKIAPQKWRLSPWADIGGGFWAVAIVGQTVVWFNDIENGFNRSRYSRLGVIDEYWCNQDEVNWTVQQILNEIHTGELSGYHAGPPKPVAEPSGQPEPPVARRLKE